MSFQVISQKSTPEEISISISTNGCTKRSETILGLSLRFNTECMTRGFHVVWQIMFLKEESASSRFSEAKAERIEKKNNGFDNWPSVYTSAVPATW